VLDRTFGLWMNARVARVRTEFEQAAQLDPRAPVLLLGNHTSFWDGFLIRKLQSGFRPEAPLYTVMLETELRKNPLLRALGGIGLEPGDGASFRALLTQLKHRLTVRPDGVVVFFPQGRIWPSIRRPLGFHGGVIPLLRRLPALQVIPVGIHLEGHNRSGLTAYVSAGPVIPFTAEDFHRSGRDRLLRTFERGVEERIDRILRHVTRFGEDAPDTWPPRGGVSPSARGTGDTDAPPSRERPFRPAGDSDPAAFIDTRPFIAGSLN
jgi:1-acyl-sn-glycerol-3-phosphate acyltransferase